MLTWIAPVQNSLWHRAPSEFRIGRGAAQRTQRKNSIVGVPLRCARRLRRKTALFYGYAAFFGGVLNAPAVFSAASFASS
jgi:hypothetical protein